MVESYAFGDSESAKEPKRRRPAIEGLHHFDLYRIADPEELDYLGWSDLSDGLCLVEWPERAPGLEARADLVVELSYAGEGRAAELRAGSERGAKLLERIDLK